MSNDPRRFLGYLDAERNASLLYRALAESTDGDQREALLELADVADRLSFQALVIALDSKGEAACMWRDVRVAAGTAAQPRHGTQYATPSK